MNHIVRGVKNGEKVTLNSIGLAGKRVVRVWTIINEVLLFSKYDQTTGERSTVDLQEVSPRHHHSAFIEDSMHDWSANETHFHFYAHSSCKGSIVDLLVVTD